MKKIFKRGMSGLLAVLMAFTVLAGFGTTTAFAASETAESYMISFPRDGDAAQIYSEDAWGHSAKNYMNGWATGSSNYTTLFLGGKEKDTLKDLAEILGKETIDLYNTSDTRGTSQSYGLNYQKTGKELMSQDEIAVMDGSKCIMQLRGVRPFFSDKFDITKHKQYPLLSDYDKKNEFDIEKYVKNRNRLRFKRNDVVDEVCDVGEIAE